MTMTILRRAVSVSILSLVAACCVEVPEEAAMAAESVTTGIVFLTTTQIDILERFYVDEVGCELWMDQGDCRIFRFGTFLFGFCQREQAQTQGVLTFVLPDRAAVDEAYERFAATAADPPRDNPRYPIYNFFARDPEGRLIEFQLFTNDPDLEALVAR